MSVVKAAIDRSPLADRDLDEIIDYLTDAGGDGLSDRFVSALLRTTVLLQGSPFIGRPCRFLRKEHSGVRRINVHGAFDPWLIFYTPSSDVIRIERVLHGARDWAALFQ